MGAEKERSLFDKDEGEDHHWLTYVLFLVIIPVSVMVYFLMKSEVKDAKK